MRLAAATPGATCTLKLPRGPTLRTASSVRAMYSGIKPAAEPSLLRTASMVTSPGPAATSFQVLCDSPDSSSRATRGGRLAILEQTRALGLEPNAINAALHQPAGRG